MVTETTTTEAVLARANHAGARPRGRGGFFSGADVCYAGLVSQN